MFTIVKIEKYIVIYSCNGIGYIHENKLIVTIHKNRMPLMKSDIEQKEPDTNVHVMSPFT